MCDRGHKNSFTLKISKCANFSIERGLGTRLSFVFVFVFCFQGHGFHTSQLPTKGFVRPYLANRHGKHFEMKNAM